MARERRALYWGITLKFEERSDEGCYVVPGKVLSIFKTKHWVTFAIVCGMFEIFLGSPYWAGRSASSGYGYFVDCRYGSILLALIKTGKYDECGAR